MPELHGRIEVYDDPGFRSVDRKAIALVKDFAIRMLDRDYHGARVLFASWLQRHVSATALEALYASRCETISGYWSPDPAQRKLFPGLCLLYAGTETDSLEHLLDRADLEEIVPFELSQASDLRYSDDFCVRLPVEISEEIFRCHFCLEFKPSQAEHDELGFDIFLILNGLVVEEAGQLRIGFFEFNDDGP